MPSLKYDDFLNSTSRLFCKQTQIKNKSATLRVLASFHINFESPSVHESEVFKIFIHNIEIRQNKHAVTNRK